MQRSDGLIQLHVACLAFTHPSFNQIAVGQWDKKCEDEVMTVTDACIDDVYSRMQLCPRSLGFVISDDGGRSGGL